MRSRLVLLSLVSLTLYAALGLGGDADIGAELWAVWGALFVVYATGVRLAAKRNEKSVFVLIFVTALVYRAAIVVTTKAPALAPDVFLYGASPLAVLAAKLELGIVGERVVAVAFDLGALALAPALLKAARIPVGAAIIHGWNPLVAVEVAEHGRLEVAGLALFLLSLRLIQTQARWPAAIVYGLSVSGAGILVAALPLVARAVRARAILGLGVALFFWELAFPQTTWIDRAGWPPESALGGSVAPVTVALANLLVTRSEVIPLAVLFTGWALFAVVRAARSGANARLPLEALVATGSFVLVSPQVLPWAFVVFAYLGAHSPNRGWIAFTATAPVSYAAIEAGSFSFWLGFAQYFVPYALLIYWWLGSPPHEAAGKRAKGSA